MDAKFRSVFDIIGPTMIGSSSSHTAGAVAIGRAAYKLFNGPIKKDGPPVISTYSFC